MNVLTMNQNVFGTTFVRKGVSRRALKAMSNPIDKSIGVEMTYDDCNEVNGGIAITEAIGLTGTALSIACTVILFVDSNIKKFLNWGWRLALKIIRFCGDIASCISVMSNLVKGNLINGVARFIAKKGGPILDANIIAGMATTYSFMSHFISFFN